MVLLCTWNEKTNDLTLTIDADAPGMEVSRAISVETEESHPARGGKFALEMPAYGVRLLRVE